MSSPPQVPRASVQAELAPREEGRHAVGGAVPHAADLELVRRVLRGEPAAEGAFLARMTCARRFLAYKNASFGAPLGGHELEDTLQSVLLAVWRKLGEYSGAGTLEAWVYRFVYLELVSRVHALDRRPADLHALSQEAEPVAEARAVPDPLECERLYRGLERLEPLAAEIIRLKHLEACTFEELSARLAIPVNTAKTRYYRGMEKLRQLLRDPRTAGGRRP